MSLLAEVPSMVGPENDHCVACCITFSQRVKHATDKSVSKGDARQIMLNCCPPAPRLSDSLKVSGFFFGKLAPGPWNVIEIFRDVFRNENLIAWVELEIFARGIPR